eukprot:TRINITY_DN2516_c0_g1_i1.p1 TRINITY_DN2516_c0_g1~~TRINITY_DN2516_c0_g1_i1.p1  ORF type:complete len:442 (+),score=72.11 TRINITY_DN2516_c0_g1_i1:851-2176(+)
MAFQNCIDEISERAQRGEADELEEALLGILGPEAEWWEGRGDFWVENAPANVEEARERLRGEIENQEWKSALVSAATIRSLQLIRLTACLSQTGQNSKFPEPPVPKSWLEHGGIEPLGVHAEVTDDPSSNWSSFMLAVTMSSTAILTLLHNQIEITGPILSTHPEFKQTRKGNRIHLRTPHTINVLLTGKVYHAGHTTLTIVEIKGYNPRTSKGISKIAGLISSELELEQEEVIVQHEEGDQVSACFPYAEQPRSLQHRLIQLSSKVWDEAWASASSIPDLQIEFPQRRNINVALSGRLGMSTIVAEEVLRQSLFKTLSKHHARWKEDLVEKITLHGSGSSESMELLWCAIGGSVDVDDSSEFEALLESAARQIYVPNMAPSTFAPHKRHMLYNNTIPNIRTAAVTLNSKLIRLLPILDPPTAERLGIASMSVKAGTPSPC